MTGFTPGPWVAEDYSESSLGLPTWYVVPADYCGTIARVDYAGKAKGDVEANARLIAAAPDLFAALCDLYFAVESGRDLPDAQNAARAAIKKAEGKA